MRRFLQSMAINRKLMAINMLLILVASTMTALIFVFVERSALRDRVITELKAQAEIVAYNVAASVVFGDVHSATEMLDSFRVVPQIHEAVVFDKKNEVFARYSVQNPNTSGVDEIASGDVHWKPGVKRDAFFVDDGILVHTEITLDGEPVGTLYLRSTLELVDDYKQQAAALGLAASLAAIVVSILFLTPMARLVSEPVVNLLATIDAVRRERNYHMRVEKRANDEFGALTDAFNAMLEEIGQRDSELIRHRSRLESEVLERTQALKKANRNLEETVEALKSANRAIRVSEENKRVAEASAETKAQFLANMSHELRTPMNGVLGMLTLLLESRLTEEQRHYVDVAYESGRILLDLLNNVLDLSKIEQGKLTLESIPFDLREAVDDVLAILGESAYSKSLEIGVLASPGVPAILKGDPTRFRQLIFNLVGNAIKFTHEGQVVVRLSLANAQQGSGRIRVAVEDTGVGIAENVKHQIFDTFTQADSSTTRKYGGSGLGLTLCREILQLMGGEIGFDSHEHQGSVFWFEMACDIVLQQRTVSSLGENVQRPDVIILDGNTLSAEVTRQSVLELGLNAHVVASTADLISRIQSPGLRFGHLMIGLRAGMEDLEALLNEPVISSQFLRSDIVLYGSIGQRHQWAMHREFVGMPSLVKPLRLHAIADAMGVTFGAAIEPAREGGQPVTLLAPRRRILVADDNAEQRQLLMLLLGKLGYQTDVADDGHGAILKTVDVTYDLIMMDCEMPVMDGLAATRKIREREAEGFPYTPVVGLMAQGVASDRDACILAGMDDYLVKPVKADELQSVLRKWFVEG